MRRLLSYCISILMCLWLFLVIGCGESNENYLLENQNSSSETETIINQTIDAGNSSGVSVENEKNDVWIKPYTKVDEKYFRDASDPSFFIHLGEKLREALCSSKYNEKRGQRGFLLCDITNDGIIDIISPIGNLIMVYRDGEYVVEYESDVNSDIYYDSKEFLLFLRKENAFDTFEIMTINPETQIISKYEGDKSFDNEYVFSLPLIANSLSHRFMVGLAELGYVDGNLNNLDAISYDFIYASEHSIDEFDLCLNCGETQSRALGLTECHQCNFDLSTPLDVIPVDKEEKTITNDIWLHSLPSETSATFEYMERGTTVNVVGVVKSLSGDASEYYLLDNGAYVNKLYVEVSGDSESNISEGRPQVNPKKNWDEGTCVRESSLFLREIEVETENGTFHFEPNETLQKVLNGVTWGQAYAHYSNNDNSISLTIGCAGYVSDSWSAYYSENGGNAVSNIAGVLTAHTTSIINGVEYDLYLSKNGDYSFIIMGNPPYFGGVMAKFQESTWIGTPIENWEYY